MNISIEYQPKLDLHIEGYRLYKSQSNLYKLDKIAGVSLIIIGSLILLSFFFISNLNLLYVFLSILFIVVGIFELTGWLDFGKLAQTYYFKSNPKYRSFQSLVFTEEKIYYKTIGINSELKWSFYNNYLENEKVIILIYGKRMYSVIPKEAFDDTELDKFDFFLIKLFGSNK